MARRNSSLGLTGGDGPRLPVMELHGGRLTLLVNSVHNFASFPVMFFKIRSLETYIGEKKIYINMTKKFIWCCRKP